MKRRAGDSKKPWLLRDVPEDLRYRAKVAAAIERKSLREFVIQLIQSRLQEMEKEGVLPKAKKDPR